MKKPQPEYSSRYFQAEIILVCVQWYLRYCLSYRDNVEQNTWMLVRISDRLTLPVACCDFVARHQVFSC